MTKTHALIAGVARHQHALITTGQLTELGISRAELRTLLRRGALERVHARTYRVTGAPRTWEQQVMAACLSSGDDAVASHRSAAQLWGLASGLDVVEVVMPRARATELRGVVTHRSSDLEPQDVTIRLGIPVTKPARTLVDLGAVSPRSVVDAAIDRALASRLTTLEGLWWMLVRVGRQGRSGAGILRRCLEWRFGVPDSVLEGLFMRIVRDYDLPVPVLQYMVRVGGRDRRIDGAYPDRRLGVELDGAEKRMSPESLRDDDRRQNDLVAAGFTFLRFTFEDLTQRQAEVARQVRDLHRRLPVVDQPAVLEQETAA
ncbi:MAG: DUF559 domain-containing protein [Actinobacteria bacterium]|nr:DUF559 domain-containing protein [Actinomycetota bacterium]